MSLLTAAGAGGHELPGILSRPQLADRSCLLRMPPGQGVE